MIVITITWITTVYNRLHVRKVQIVHVGYRKGVWGEPIRERSPKASLINYLAYLSLNKMLPPAERSPSRLITTVPLP